MSALSKVETGNSGKGLFAPPSGAGLSFRNKNRRKATSLTNAFAKRLAEHGDIALASDEIGVSRQRGRGFFRRICDELGDQAE